MRTLTKVATAVSSALLMSVALTAQAALIPPAGYADSALNVTGFQILGFNPITMMNYDLTNPSLAANGITSLSAKITGTVSTSINLVPGTPQVGSDLSGQSINPLANTIPAPSLHMQYLAGGPSPGFPLVSLPIGSLNPGTYAAGTLDHYGNGLNENGNGFTTALTHDQVNLSSASFGSADSRQTLLTTFVLNVTTAEIFDVLFNAAADLRVALAQPGVSADASRTWNLTVRNVGTGNTLLNWSPDGITGDLIGTCTLVPGACTELADAFDLQAGLSLLNTIGDIQLVNAGDFGVRVALLPGSYQITVSHFTSTDAAVIPEPGSLALLGAALLGFAGMRRKSKKA